MEADIVELIPAELATIDLETGEIMERITGQKCTAHSSRTGQPCKNYAIRGGTVCRYHGGAAPQVKEAAAKRVADARDSALEALQRRLVEDGDRLDPKVLLDAVNTLSKLAELLEGRATSREESRTLEQVQQVKIELHGRLEALAERHERNMARLSALEGGDDGDADESDTDGGDGGVGDVDH